MVWSSPICPSILNGADLSLNYVVNSYLSRRIDLLSSHRPMVRVSSDQSIRTEGRPSKLVFRFGLRSSPYQSSGFRSSHQAKQSLSTMTSPSALGQALRDLAINSCSQSFFPSLTDFEKEERLLIKALSLNCVDGSSSPFHSSSLNPKRHLFQANHLLSVEFRPVNLDVTGLGKSPSVSLDTAPAAEDNVVEEFVVLNVDRTVFQEESNLTGQIKLAGTTTNQAGYSQGIADSIARSPTPISHLELLEFLPSAPPAHVPSSKKVEIGWLEGRESARDFHSMVEVPVDSPCLFIPALTDSFYQKPCSQGDSNPRPKGSKAGQPQESQGANPYFHVLILFLVHPTTLERVQWPLLLDLRLCLSQRQVIGESRQLAHLFWSLLFPFISISIP
ncbi:hypothetical protein Salat_2997100, partial [Sesamum alatum]